MQNCGSWYDLIPFFFPLLMSLQSCFGFLSLNHGLPSTPRTDSRFKANSSTAVLSLNLSLFFFLDLFLISSFNLILSTIFHWINGIALMGFFPTIGSLDLFTKVCWVNSKQFTFVGSRDMGRWFLLNGFYAEIKSKYPTANDSLPPTQY